MKNGLNKVITHINRLNEKVASYKPLVQNQVDRLIQKLKLDWNYHSSKIEGNTLTYGETVALLNWGITAQGKPLIDHIQMKGHDQAINYIMDVIKGEERPLNEIFIRDIHTLILGKEPYQIDARTFDGIPTKKWIYPGQYKKQPNHVITPTGAIFYFASPEETPAKMQELLGWYKSSEKDLHPLILAATFHYQFVRIHPFDDGNGRAARILMNFILMKNGLVPAIIHSEKKLDYYQVLALADAGDLEKFIEYIGGQEINSLELLLKVAKGESVVEEEDFDKQVDNLKMEFNDVFKRENKL